MTRWIVGRNVKSEDSKKGNQIGNKTRKQINIIKDSVISSSFSTSMKRVEKVQESTQDPDMVTYASQLSLKFKSQLNGNFLVKFNKNRIRRPMFAGEKEKLQKKCRWKLFLSSLLQSLETLKGIHDLV